MRTEHQAIVLDGPGGPEMLTWRSVPTPTPGPGELLVDVSVAGVNFMDTGTGTGQPGPFPLVPGVEGAGRTADLGAGVEDLEVGQRIGWRFAWGSYAERVSVPAGQAVALPDDIDDDVAAALLLRGLSAQHFVDGFSRLQAGATVLVHAAAGGVGLLITQLAKHRGARVIGRVSTAEKGAVATKAGADAIIVDANGRFAEQVKDLFTAGGLGADSYKCSLRASSIASVI